MKINNFFVLLLSLIIVGCALPIGIYEENSDYKAKHLEFDTSSLNCTELNLQIVRVQGILKDIADRLTENANRSTASTSIGIQTNNPRRGTNFFGFKSSSVDPTVNEFRDTLSVLEEMQILQIDKCSSEK
ncbi:hypothetical protein N9T42_00805 [SAR86 cluster bacterium]|jgi:hypothetical protein|nr:hypothetical protein [SAR86 cluster bacterium]